MKLKKQLKGKVIYDIHELESERINLSEPAKKHARRLEKKYLAKTDAIITVSNEIRDWYIKHYPPIPHPLVVRNIPQSITRPLGSNPIFREKFPIPKDKIILLYNGGLTKARGIDLLLEAAAHSELSENIVFVFMGFGALVPAIKAHTLYGTRMFYHEAVPMKDVPCYTAGADMGFSILYNSCLNHDYALPNKLFEYISAGIGVIGGTTLTQKKLIDENRVGLCALEETPQAYITLINSLTKEKIDEYKKNSKKLRDSLSWENEVIPMIDLYKKLLP
jgi:glycosyltransferase involved in cell wall biosynthesis